METYNPKMPEIRRKGLGRKLCEFGLCSLVELAAIFNVCALTGAVGWEDRNGDGKVDDLVLRVHPYECILYSRNTRNP